MQPHDARIHDRKRSLIDPSRPMLDRTPEHRPDSYSFIESLRDASDKDGLSDQPPPRLRRPSSATTTVFRRPRAETFSFFPSKLLPEDSVAPADHNAIQHSSSPNSSSSASAIPVGRQRAGSLSLPRSSIAGAFGPSLFATSWQPSSVLNGMERSGHSDYASSTGGEDETTAVARTLDYLGLDDPMSNEGGNRHQQHASNNAYQQLAARNVPIGAPISSIYGLRGRSYSVAVGETMSLSNNSLPPPATYRPRATSIAFLESTADSDIQAIRMSLANGELELRMESPDTDLSDADLYNALGQSSPYNVDRAMSDSPTTRHLDFPHPHQVPSRSLWIGNIDPTLSPSDLLTLFSPFGPIESLRILPDKECAFVNFVHVEDAVRARDDMQSGRVGNCIVRIGFGKAEAINDTQGMQPTKSLWVGNIPPTTDPAALEAMFAAYGAVESARVLTHKNCGFINFVRLEDAMEARKNMNGKEIGGSVVKIGYAKVPPRGNEQAPQLSMAGNNNNNNNGFAVSASPTRGHHNNNGDYAAYQVPGSVVFAAGASGAAGAHSTGLQGQYFVAPSAPPGRFAAASGGYPHDAGGGSSPRVTTPSRREPTIVDSEDAKWNGPSVTETYAQVIPPVPDPRSKRRVDQVRLRELRKRLESHVTAKDVEAFFTEIIDEAVDLCTDYIGNVVVQKIIEKATDQHRLRLMEKIAPHMAAIGIHKNGTWVIQKMIDYAKTTSQIQVVVNALKVYTPPLLLDQFGNYVVQCCLRLGAHRNQFVFDAMHAQCYEIGQGRFGARAMRACLENQHTTKRQQKFVAEAIVHNVIQLATNPNGAILVTWLLDTSNLPGRYGAMAPKLVPNLAALCAHKLASATVLKLVNQRVEPEAREQIVKEMFFHEEPNVVPTLHYILSDAVHGVSIVQKILNSACASHEERVHVADRVRNTLHRMQEVRDNHAAYKRILDELSLIPTLEPVVPPMLDPRRFGAASSASNADEEEVVSPMVPGGGFTYSPVPASSPSQAQPPPQQQGGGWYTPAQLPTPTNSPQPGSHFVPGFAAAPGGAVYALPNHHAASTPPPPLQPHQHHQHHQHNHHQQQQYHMQHAQQHQQQQYYSATSSAAGSYPPSPQHPAAAAFGQNGVGGSAASSPQQFQHQVPPPPQQQQPQMAMDAQYQPYVGGGGQVYAQGQYQPQPHYGGGSIHPHHQPQQLPTQGKGAQTGAVTEDS
ncbi:hypothetical protein HDU90_007066 [Geranomyces variabilis]|nr:hypothetical protein HDU90_007066 [Geranomyces variabilis]